MKNLIYAGIGSRQTPPNILLAMELLGQQLSKHWHLRSGYAQGADKAFGKGAYHADGEFTMILPWDGFNDAPLDDPRFVTPTPTPELVDLAMQYHPNWDACSSAAKMLHARNGCQIMGLDLQTPVDMVVCWTPQARAGGGTGQAIRIAKGNNIPVFDLADPAQQHLLIEFINVAEQEVLLAEHIAARMH